MFVCICNGVTDSQIRQAAAAGCREVSELTMRTGCGATCGSCLDMAGDLLRSHAAPAQPAGAIYEFPLIASAA
ncbi:(2Fe-2S)-binding protein [Luteimonas sp. BDR2-5]|uniref:(2Fe-2S)-binding protein n=1 Tax=Proluteimonas luteida TaxID=2878685 RepID=UPI001E339748|nr:(2Fe-2S)-binding protein [Luteimonas sp. BDR2-5]MCD9029364.1 (2Fe-2S)-binding protein [Luteimonas sp. BDR2-5]